MPNAKTKANYKEKSTAKKTAKSHIKGNKGRCYSRSFQVWMTLECDLWKGKSELNIHQAVAVHTFKSQEAEVGSSL